MLSWCEWWVVVAALWIAQRLAVLPSWQDAMADELPAIPRHVGRALVVDCPPLGHCAASSVCRSIVFVNVFRLGLNPASNCIADSRIIDGVVDLFTNDRRNHAIYALYVGWECWVSPCIGPHTWHWVHGLTAQDRDRVRKHVSLGIVLRQRRQPPRFTKPIVKPFDEKNGEGQMRRRNFSTVEPSSSNIRRAYARPRLWT